jgi:hypothetical protein
MQLIVGAKCVYVGDNTIRLTGPTKLAERQKTVGGQVVNPKLKGFKNLTQKTDRGEAKATSEVILENDSIALHRRRDGLTHRRRHSTASLEETVI